MEQSSRHLKVAAHNTARDHCLHPSSLQTCHNSSEPFGGKTMSSSMKTKISPVDAANAGISPQAEPTGRLPQIQQRAPRISPSGALRVLDVALVNDHNLVRNLVTGKNRANSREG